MATNLHRIAQNFAYHMEQISPATTVGHLRPKFEEVDGLRFEPEQASGLSRVFTVRWVKSDADEGTTDYWDREANHTFEVTVWYTTKLRWQTLHQVILQDRHDIIKQLRDQSKFVGYDADNTAANIGIDNRFRTGDELDIRSEQYWALRFTYEVTVQEVEA